VDVNITPVPNPGLPYDQHVILSEGTSATFYADYYEGANGVTVSWEYSSDGGETWNTIDGAVTTTLALEDVVIEMNEWLYRAVFTNDCGFAYSREATLTVETGCEQATVATVAPDDVEIVLSGVNDVLPDVAVFTVTTDVDDIENQTMTYQWQVAAYGSETFSDLEGENDQTLTVSADDYEMSGNQYRCIVGADCSEDPSITSDVAVLWVVEPLPTQATNITWEFWSTNMIRLGWTAPDENQTGFIVLAKQINTGQITYQVPNHDSFFDLVNPVFGAGTPITTGVYVVSNKENDETLQEAVTGLQRDTRYSFKVIAYFNENGDNNIRYNNTNTSGNPRARRTAPKDVVENDLPITGESELSISNLAPNPASNYVNLTMNLNSDQNVRIALYNDDGKLVMNVVDGQQFTNGTHSFEIPLTEIASGHYTLIIGAGNEVIIEQIVVVK
jgi:hypothetical protein